MMSAELASGGTFELGRAGVDVHPLLTLSTAHQEVSHRLSGQEGVRLGYLKERRVCKLRFIHCCVDSFINAGFKFVISYFSDNDPLTALSSAGMD